MNQLSCVQIREGVSALLDGEESGIQDEILAAHLEGCGACQVWRTKAQRLTRAVRLTSVEVPDLTEQVLNTIATDTAIAHQSQALRGRRQILRIALACSAVVQLLLAIPFLLHTAGSTPFGMNPDVVRIGWEMAAFQIALAVGYLGVAWVPSRAQAFLPAAFALAAILLLIGIRDVATHPITLTHHIGHLLAVLQAGLLWGLARQGLPILRPHAVEHSTQPDSRKLRTVI